jgi:Ca-activated chloride channel family protein
MFPESWTFANPLWLWAAAATPVLFVFLFFQQRLAKVEMTTSGKLTKGNPTGNYLFWVPALLRTLAVTFVFLALARPQNTDEVIQTTDNEGIDIMMAIDVSTSMTAMDFKPNRLEGVKAVARDFIESRVGDRIGLVVYGGESFTQTPLTTDHNIVRANLQAIKFGMVKDQPAIGMGLATAVKHVVDSPSEGKVIILLTDGVNNTGFVDPITAAELAHQYNIRVYTIGVGTNGMAPVPAGKDFMGKTVYQNFPVEIDEELLRNIADITGGQYFRATDNNKLESIYEEIDQLEKSKVEELRFYRFQEMFYPLAFIALAFLLLEVLWKRVWFKNAFD